MFTKNKKELLIHIGAGKTGTTSLQHFLWANRRALQRHGILYPDLGVVSGAHHLLSPHHPPFLDWKFISAKDWAPDLYAKTKQRALISSELASNAAPDVIRPFAEHVNQHFNTKIVIYVRRQDHWMVAAYSQQVKAGTQRLDFPSSLGHMFRGANLVGRMSVWIEAFGADNVIVRPYERGQLVGGDIRSDFLSQVLAIDDDANFKWTNANENPRLALCALEYKRMINNVVPVPAESNAFIDPLLAYSAAEDQNSTAIYHESNLISPTERNMILERVDDGNRWVASKLMGRADGVLFIEPRPEQDPGWLPPVVTSDDLARISTYFSAKGYRKSLMQCIEKTLETNRFEAYRYAQTLAASFGRKL
ncbi:hypothetical protein AUC68_12745 [Methyloceanibacter methanicus]|uniref:Sulfotransferase domain-containing protein n=1 Tax=Methyloceanibacter methanicus TaxID=1774968 RepID=A0A1E3W5X1_9HYPH|nr:hypothetical protein [Methyloceanibacter methanicus]ODS01225.1 hypothetical protein AUC68_12745 [Methyloceanibacter methanicus]